MKIDDVLAAAANRDLVATERRLRELLAQATEDLHGRVQYLVNFYTREGSEGFTFPDGDHWPRTEKV